MYKRYSFCTFGLDGMILASGARGPGFADFPGIDEICATFTLSREVGLRGPIAKVLQQSMAR